LTEIQKTGKPVGYSLFKKEITPFLPEWFEGTLDLAWSKKNDRVSLLPTTLGSLRLISRVVILPRWNSLNCYGKIFKTS
jgi:hypothetical protein